MEAGRNTSFESLLDRLRSRGREYSDVRAILSRGVELPPSLLIHEFGTLFSGGVFRPLKDSDDIWRLTFYRENWKPTPGERWTIATANERQSIARPISRELQSLCADALWLAGGAGWQHVQGIKTVAPGNLHQSYLSWLWLLFQVAWECPAGTVLRATKNYPAPLVTQQRLGENPSEAEQLEALGEALAERDERLAAGAYISILPVDPFTASAEMLELIAEKGNEKDDKKRRKDNPRDKTKKLPRDERTRQAISYVNQHRKKARAGVVEPMDLCDIVAEFAGEWGDKEVQRIYRALQPDRHGGYLLDD